MGNIGPLEDEISNVRAGHEFDDRRLADFLRGKVPGCTTPISVRQFRGGQSNPTFLIETQEERYVLRKKPPGVLLPSAHQVEREYRVMRALAGTGVPVPAVRLLCEDATIIGTSFYLMDFADGRIFRDTRLPQQTAAERAAIYHAMAETLARIHRVDWRAAGLTDFGKPQDYVRRQIERWTRQYELSRTHELPAMDRLITWLRKNLPPDEETVIAHGDYRLENLVFHPSEPRVIAVLDWELATLGHPLSDLAYNCMPYEIPSTFVALGGIADVDRQALGIPSEMEYVAAYCRGAARAAPANWTFFKAFALFRSAAILQGVYARARQNNASSSDALKIGLLAGPVAEIGWRLVA